MNTTNRDLRVTNLEKSFGDFRAINRISLTIRAGEFLTILGPSGSGKTTFLNMVAGFLDTDGGTMTLGDRDITHLPPETRDFGMVFQGYALFPHLSVFDNVAFPLKVRKWSSDKIARHVEEALDLVQLGNLRDRMPKQLSGGQQQRVALARAMVFRPNLLLLDEPLSALDKKLRAEMQEELKRLHRKVGLTFIYITHDQDEALSMSDRVVVMRNGVIVQQGRPDELYKTPRTSFVAGFLGRSNFLRGDVVSRDGEELTIRNGDLVLRQHAGTATLQPGDTALIALRPEAVSLIEGDAQADNVIEATVSDSNYFGSNFSITAETDHFGTFELTMPAAQLSHDLAVGSRIRLGWSASAGVIVEDDE